MPSRIRSRFQRFRELFYSRRTWTHVEDFPQGRLNLRPARIVDEHGPVLRVSSVRALTRATALFGEHFTAETEGRATAEISPITYSHLYEPFRPSDKDEDDVLVCHICTERMITGITIAASLPHTSEDTQHSSDSDEAPSTPIPELVVTLRQCSHTFGMTCLVRWLSSSLTCPMCRADLSDSRPRSTSTSSTSTSSTSTSSTSTSSMDRPIRPSSLSRDYSEGDTWSSLLRNSNRQRSWHTSARQRHFDASVWHMDVRSWERFATDWQSAAERRHRTMTTATAPGGDVVVAVDTESGDGVILASVPMPPPPPPRVVGRPPRGLPPASPFAAAFREAGREPEFARFRRRDGEWR